MSICQDCAAGPKGRWKTRLVNMVKEKGGEDAVQDASISPVIRQNLLHWSVLFTSFITETVLVLVL